MNYFSEQQQQEKHAFAVGKKKVCLFVNIVSLYDYWWHVYIKGIYQWGREIIDVEKKENIKLEHCFWLFIVVIWSIIERILFHKPPHIEQPALQIMDILSVLFIGQPPPPPVFFLCSICSGLIYFN